MRLLRQLIRDESGFTLIELLMVMLIIGLLATMALGTFLSKRATAADATAKSLINDSEQAATIYGVNGAGYNGMTAGGLKAVISSINIVPNGQAVLATAAPTATGYTLIVVSSTADTFVLTNANSAITRTCTVAAGNGNTSTNTGGGCNAGYW